MVLCRSNTTTTSQNNYTSGSGAAGIDSGMGSETSSLLLSDKNSDKSDQKIQAITTLNVSVAE